MLVKGRLSKVQRQKTQIKLTFTCELNESDIDFESFDGFPGYLKFAGKPIAKEIEEAMNNRHFAVETDKKTPSQIQRGDILTLWSLEHPELKVSPETYYVGKMEEIHNWLKSRIKTRRNEE